MPPNDLPQASGQGVFSSIQSTLKSLLPALTESQKALGPLVLVLVLPIAAIASFLVSPGFYAQQVPEITQEEVGRPFRAGTSSGFKANRDFQVEDEQSTRLRREEAKVTVPPVYDFDPSVQVTVQNLVQESFAHMRSLSGEKRDLDSSTVERLQSARARFPAMQTLDDEDFELFLRARFSSEVERTVISLLDSAYQNKLVNSREELNRFLGLGMVVRAVGQQAGEEIRLDVASPEVRDLRETQVELDRFAQVPFDVVSKRNLVLRKAVLRFTKKLLRPNLTINTAETDERRRAAAQAVKPSVITVRKGQRVIGDGELINETHRVILNSMRAQADDVDRLRRYFGTTGVVAVIWLVGFAFMWASFKRFRPARKDLFLLGFLLLSVLTMAQVWMTIAEAIHERYGFVPVESLYLAMPIAAGAMLVRFILTAELSLYFAVMLSSLAGMMMGNSLSFGLYSLAGSLVAAHQVARARDRVAIFRAGFVTALSQMALMLFLMWASGQSASVETAWSLLFSFLGASVGVPVTVMTLAPLFENTLGYASDLKLLELANLNHPALKELIVQAPGTYHHSIIIGSLVESAAEAIGANPLLAKTCAYYHDIGKGRNPVYFGENQKTGNKHDELAPAMSAVIIKRHVTEGLEMAKKYKLPKLVADAIPQHHGTRLVGYFFHKAVKEQEGRENPTPVDDSVYRYPGPKPQFREAALVMIADAVEAASRSMAEPTSEKLQALVQKLINMISGEGQLDECELTLKDLQLISQSFVSTLEGIYHARPAYPPAVFAQSGRPELSIARSEPSPDVRKINQR